jgi:hypothetical protein
VDEVAGEFASLSGDFALGYSEGVNHRSWHECRPTNTHQLSWCWTSAALGWVTQTVQRRGEKTNTASFTTRKRSDTISLSTGIVVGVARASECCATRTMNSVLVCVPIRDPVLSYLVTEARAYPRSSNARDLCLLMTSRAGVAASAQLLIGVPAPCGMDGPCCDLSRDAFLHHGDHTR